MLVTGQMRAFEPERMLDALSVNKKRFPSGFNTARDPVSWSQRLFSASVNNINSYRIYGVKFGPKITEAFDQSAESHWAVANLRPAFNPVVIWLFRNPGCGQIWKRNGYRSSFLQIVNQLDVVTSSGHRNPASPSENRASHQGLLPLACQ